MFERKAFGDVVSTAHSDELREAVKEMVRCLNWGERLFVSWRGRSDAMESALNRYDDFDEFWDAHRAVNSDTNAIVRIITELGQMIVEARNASDAILAVLLEVEQGDYPF